MPGRNNQLIALAFQGSRRTNVVLACVLTLLFIAVSTGAGVLLMDRVLFPTGSYQEDPSLGGAWWLLLDLVLGFGPIIFLVWMWLCFFEIRPFSSVGLTSRNIASKLLGGAALGVAIVAICFALMSLPREVTMELEVNNNFPGVAALVSLILVGIGWTVQASAEEILLRGWLLQTATLRFGIVVGIGVSSVAFMLIHFMGGTNSFLSAINLILGGTFYALFALYQGSIWGVCAIHAAMNFSEQHLFGFGTNGNIPGGTIFEMEASGPDLLTGGAVRTGAAASLTYTLVLVVGVTVLLLLFRRRANATP